MLWRRPARAQAPIVDVRKCTFAAARMDCASSSVIQSAAEPVIPQSFPDPASRAGALAGFAVPAVEPGDDPPPEASALGVPDSEAVAPGVFDGAAGFDERSFFAHPVPLKWTAGGAKALRSWPPQAGHSDGPCACTPCMTSIRCPHDEQT